jgi:hypothetical protein
MAAKVPENFAHQMGSPQQFDQPNTGYSPNHGSASTLSTETRGDAATSEKVPENFRQTGGSSGS